MNVLIVFMVYWHCDENNKLCHGILSQTSQKCKTSYNIYVPNNLHDCLCIIILSTNPHNHPPLLPIKMPPQIVDCFEVLLANWPLTLDLSTISTMLLHGPIMNVTPLCTISIHHLAILITCDASLMSYECPIFCIAQDSMVHSICISILPLTSLLQVQKDSLVSMNSFHLITTICIV